MKLLIKKPELIKKEDVIYIGKKRLESYEEYIQKGQLLSPIDGVVSFVKSDLVGSLTEKDAVIIRIYDPESKLYYSENTENKGKQLFYRCIRLHPS